MITTRLIDDVGRGSERRGYLPCRARLLMQWYPTVMCVRFFRAEPGARECPPPTPGVITYRMSTGGRWGISADWRVHPTDAAHERTREEVAASCR